MSADRTPDEIDDGTLLEKRVDRRDALGLLLGGVAAGVAAMGACTPLSAATPEEREVKLLEWEQFFQKHYRRMTPEERAETVERLERLAKLRHDEDVTIHTTNALPGVLFGYAFNISKCKGYRRCVEACINENNLDRHATRSTPIFENTPPSPI
jgi:molybdopterin-containing oxidoreductase family iron-sulfur binding subunit